MYLSFRSIVVKITTYLWENDDERLLETEKETFSLNFFSKLIYGLLMTRKKMSVILLIRNKHYQQLPLPQYRESRMD